MAAMTSSLRHVSTGMTQQADLTDSTVAGGSVRAALTKSD